MSTPFEEHDYIGLSGQSPMENSEKSSTSTSESSNERKCLNLKATELRLGLPGSESPERETGHGLEEKTVNPLGVVKNLVSGAKRGFFDTIDGNSEKWVLSGNGGSDADMASNGGLFSPRGVNVSGKVLTVGGSESSIQKSAMASSAGKESVSPSPRQVSDKKSQVSTSSGHESAPAAKAQVVGWPPIRSFRKNSMAPNTSKNDEKLYVKVSMDGAPYLRKVDLRTCGSYMELSSALGKMFSCFTIGQGNNQTVPIHDKLSEIQLMDVLHCSEYVLTYEDKDADWMLVGDVPWEMFIESCRRLRIMKSSDAIGLAPRAMEKCRERN